MSDNFPVIRRATGIAPNSELAPLGSGGGMDTAQSADRRVSPTGNARQMDELVDMVVERIEQRVIDELERRGRRAQPGAF